MSFYIQPEKELTPEEKLLTEVIAVNQRIPMGGQIALSMQLGTAIQAVTELFTAHDLLHNEEILAELEAWRAHVDEGLKFSTECDRLMTSVIQAVSDTIPKPPPLFGSAESE